MNTPEAHKLIAVLREHIEDTTRRGKIFYLHGAMAGFDLLAAEQVIVMKEKYPQIQLVTIAPYKERFFSREKCWMPDWISRAHEVFSRQDIGVKIAAEYRSGIYYERNRILIDHSSELICYWDGGRGGSEYTVKCAQSRGYTIHNLYPGK